MKIINVSEFRKNIAEIIREIGEGETYLVTTIGGKPMIAISHEECEDLKRAKELKDKGSE